MRITSAATVHKIELIRVTRSVSATVFKLQLLCSFLCQVLLFLSVSVPGEFSSKGSFHVFILQTS